MDRHGSREGACRLGRGSSGLRVCLTGSSRSTARAPVDLLHRDAAVWHREALLEGIGLG